MPSERNMTHSLLAGVSSYTIQAPRSTNGATLTKEVESEADGTTASSRESISMCSCGGTEKGSWFCNHWMYVAEALTPSVLSGAGPEISEASDADTEEEGTDDDDDDEEDAAAALADLSREICAADCDAKAVNGSESRAACSVGNRGIDEMICRRCRLEMTPHSSPGMKEPSPQTIGHSDDLELPESALLAMQH